MKKTIAILLCLALLAGAAGCVGPAGASNGNAIPGKTGRYLEQVMELPALQGDSEQFVIGLSPLENGVEIFTCTYSDNGDGTSTVHYFRHTILDDGTVNTTDEAWLNALAVSGGNSMRVLRAEDGALYMFYSGFTADYQMQPHFLVSRDDGKTGSELTGDGISTVAIANSFGVLSDGELAYSDSFNGSIGMLDANGNGGDPLVGEMQKVVPTVAALGSRVATIAPEAKAVRVYDRSNQTETDYPYEFAENSLPILGFAPDGALYLCDSTGLYRHTPDGTIWERLMDGGTCNLGLPSFYPDILAVRGGSPDRIYIANASGVYCYWYNADAPATAGEQIHIFSLHENETIQQAVVAFNRAQSDVLAVYDVAMGQDAGATEQDYIKALNTELLAGNGPDIIVLDGLPIDSYVQKGVLTDIGGILDENEPLLANIRTASQASDGKLYAMPSGIQVPMAFADTDPKSMVASLKSLADACEGAGEVPLLSNAAFNYQVLAETLLSYYGQDIYAGKDGAVEAFLTDSERISKAIGASAELGEGWEIAEKSTQAELLSSMRLNNSGPQLWAVAANRATGALLSPFGSLYGGMITLAAAEQFHKTLSDICQSYVPVGFVGLNSASPHTAAATSFLKALFSYEVQSGNQFAEQFPVNQKALEAVLGRVDNSVSSGMWIDNTTSLTAEWPSEETRNMLLGMIQSLTKPISTDHTLSDMLSPLIIGYLDGSDTLETTTGKMKSVISTYLSE